MMRWFLPPQAATFSRQVDALYLFLIALTVVVVLGIFSAIAYFVIRYHKSADVDRGNGTFSSFWLETTWMAVPLIISAGLFLWGARIYLRMNSPPGSARDIYVVGMRWMWKVQHPQGPREINSLHVPMGVPIRLIMTSEDAIHSFYVPAFRVKKDVLPGRYTDLWFQAVRPGTYHLFCAEYCGASHSGMIGEVTVMLPQDFQRWLAGASDWGGESLAGRGAKLFRSMGCSGCHGTGGEGTERGATARAPRLDGLYGKPVPLQGDGFAIADDAYIRESIYFPLKQVVAGYDPVMPSFSGVASEEDVMALVAYIKSLAPDPPSAGPAPGRLSASGSSDD